MSYLRSTLEAVARRTYTPEQRAQALALYETDGPTAVEQRLGVPKGTVAGWARASGVQTRSVETKGAGVRSSALTMAERRLALADELMGDIERLRRQLWAGCVERRAMVVSDGAEMGSHVEIVDIERTQPTFGEQKSIMTTLAIAVDKVQILTGEATERIDHRHTSPIDDELAQLSAELESQA